MEALLGQSELSCRDRAAKAIRDHWHIENCSHYVRDGSFAEDASRIRCNPGIFARLRSFAANILRFNGIHNVSDGRHRIAFGGISAILAMRVSPAPTPRSQPS
jgi:hypothetical protein